MQHNPLSAKKSKGRQSVSWPTGVFVSKEKEREREVTGQQVCLSAKERKGRERLLANRCVCQQRKGKGERGYWPTGVFVSKEK